MKEYNRRLETECVNTLKNESDLRIGVACGIIGEKWQQISREDPNRDFSPISGISLYEGRDDHTR